MPSIESLVDQFKASQTVASQMPVRLGPVERLDTFHGACSGCRRRIPDDLFRGSVTRPTETAACIDAVGFCADCGLLTPFIYRVHRGGRMTGLLQGHWREWRAAPASLTRALRWLLGPLSPR